MSAVYPGRDGCTPLASQTTPLQQSNTQALYGTVPTHKVPSLSFHPSLLHPSGFSQSPRLSHRPGLSGHTESYPATPHESSPTPSYSIPRSQRPISAYDLPLEDSTEQVSDARTNGIRVWYSSFTSIDWLHDAIKDSARFSRLRRTTKVRLLLDRGLGWLIVTVVGFVTACVAFLVIRSEQWLFDLKEGYCDDAWYKAKRFCCFSPVSSGLKSPWLLEVDAVCPAWRTWSEVFAQYGTRGEMVDYLSWITIALVLAGTSCFLTLNLSKSSTFTTRKESGVLKPEFSDPRTSHNPSHSQRKVMYYAAGAGVPEIKTILSGFVIHGFLGGRTLFTKAVGLPLVVASGLSLGKEGPFVHIASCIGNIVSRIANKYENNEAKRREILSAACAAGVSVAFGAPIGGTLFSLEEVSYYFPPKAGVIPGLYAMVGAAAALSGVTRTTVSLAVIMFELTDTLTYAVPVMLAVLVAKTVADALEPKGIYDFIIELNQLPFLNSKHEYLWGNLQIQDAMLRDVDTIQFDENNTVSSLRHKLDALRKSGNDDEGFPILKKDFNEDGSRMIGYIGASELEHALTVIEDVDTDKGIQFQENYTQNMTASSMSLDSRRSTRSQADPFDFSVYMDQAPLTITSKSPMELLHQFFVKLGARYVVVTDSDGLYEGVVDKKTWLAFLNNLDEKS
ncbi:hypothetical protein Ac2012v2_004996 [Leucoagaricus gongylophorus]